MVVWKHTAFDQKSLQVSLVDILVIPVVNRFEKEVQAEIVPACQLLFEHFLLARKLQLFVDQPGKQLFNIVRQKLIRTHFVGVSLSCRSS